MGNPAEARRELEVFTKTGNRSVKGAVIMLALDAAWGRTPDTETRIADSMGVSRQTVQHVTKDFGDAVDRVAFLRRKRRETPPVPAPLTGELEARISARACSKPPEGHGNQLLKTKYL
jgi:hypothetical protein